MIPANTGTAVNRMTVTASWPSMTVATTTVTTAALTTTQALHRMATAYRHRP